MLDALRHGVRLLFLLPALLVVVGGPRVNGAPPSANRHLLVVLDGLRPDDVTPQLMPNLYALGRQGVVFESHHSVFPTVTRVNASSIATGTYPGTHGLMGNSVFFPQVDARRFLDTADRTNLVTIDTAVQGHLLTTRTLSEILQASGRKVLAVGSGSTGATYLLNHKLAGGAILHTSYAMPQALSSELRSRFGEAPPAGTPNDARNRRAVDLFLDFGLKKIVPAVTMMWLSDPDTTAHEHGVGHPITIDALKRLDGEIKRLQDGLRAAGMLDSYNIWVTSDHGFSTHTAGVNLASIVRPFAGTLPDGSPRIVTGGGMVYVRDHDRAVVSAMVKVLQRTPGVGAIFTAAAAPGEMYGQVAGTLSFDAVRWNHPRSPEILISDDWTDAKNAHGYAGTTASSGVAGHGSSSPFDIHATFIAAGPDLKQHAVVRSPTGNVDFAPTFLQLLGVDIPASMQGRVLEEAMRAGPEPASVQVQPMRVSVANADGTYTLTAVFSGVESPRGSHRYFDYTRVERR